VIDISLHDPGKTVADADNIDAFQFAADCCSADNAVDAGCRSAPHKDSQFFLLLHIDPPFAVNVEASISKSLMMGKL